MYSLPWWNLGLFPVSNASFITDLNCIRSSKTRRLSRRGLFFLITLKWTSRYKILAKIGLVVPSSLKGPILRRSRNLVAIEAYSLGFHGALQYNLRLLNLRYCRLVKSNEWSIINPLCFQNNTAQIWKALSRFQSLSQKQKSYHDQYL